MDLVRAASAPFERPLSAATAQEIYQHLSPTSTRPDPHADDGRTIRSLLYVPYHTSEPVIITNDQAYHTGSIQHNILSYDQTCRNSMVCY